jgi:hypothetical protein
MEADPGPSRQGKVRVQAANSAAHIRRHRAWAEPPGRAHSGPRPHRHRHHEACRRAVIPRYPGVATGPQTELPEVVLPATAKIGDPSAGQVSYTLDQTTVAFTSGPPPAEATVGAPYTFSFTASGSPAPTFALASGRLPDGLTLDAAGKLSGAPTTAGTHTFTGTATNPAGAATGGPYTITVDAKPAVTSGAPPAGSVGVPYDFAFTASGVPAPTFTLASGALPGGLALDQDGRLHGTPTREGSYTFSVSAQNRAGSATAGPYTMVIDVPLGVDQVVSFDRTTSAVQLRSPAMAVSAGELVLAHVSADGPSSRRQQVTSLTGGGLRWSLAARSNTGRGTAEIWQASTTQAISQLRVTAKLAHDGYHGSITVASFKGRQVVGATSAAAAGSKGAPGVTLTPARDRSLVWAAAHDATRAQAPLPARRSSTSSWTPAPRTRSGPSDWSASRAEASPFGWAPLCRREISGRWSPSSSLQPGGSCNESGGVVEMR